MHKEDNVDPTSALGYCWKSNADLILSRPNRRMAECFLPVKVGSSPRRAPFGVPC